MPEIENSIRAESSVPSALAPVHEVRFDPAHDLPRAAAKVPLDQPAEMSPDISADAIKHSEATESQPQPSSSSPNEAITPELIQQFRLQAQQLAGHLDGRQRDLDRREAELHARIAQQENAARNARLWFQERNSELDDRKTRLDEREQKFNSRLVEFDEQLDYQRTSATSQALSAQHDEQVLRDLDLQRRYEALNDFAVQIEQRQQHCLAHEKRLKERDKILSAAEAALARSQVDWDSQCQLEQKQRDEIQARLQQQQAKTIDQCRQIEVELQTQREALASRSEQLERRSTALDQLRSDLLRVQRETLEMRLATEELWAQLSGVASPAALTQSLARLRSQLLESYRAQAADIAVQRSEIEQLADRVAGQHQQLSAQKRDWQQAVTAQQRQIESQAATLAAREEDLNRQQRRLYQAQQAWDAQRRQLEQEIRRLQTELRNQDAELTA